MAASTPDVFWCRREFTPDRKSESRSQTETFLISTADLFDAMWRYKAALLGSAASTAARIAMNAGTTTQLPQPQRDRLKHIELRLHFLGEVRRADLMARLRGQSAAASRDLAPYKELAPFNAEFGQRSKLYVLGHGFTPLFEMQPDQALSWLVELVGDRARRDVARRPVDPAPVHQVGKGAPWAALGALQPARPGFVCRVGDHLAGEARRFQQPCSLP